MYAAISRSEPVPPVAKVAVGGAPADQGPALARYRGGARASFVLKDGVTRLADLRQMAPCRIAFPRPSPGDPLTAVLITTSGGLAGGDEVSVGISVGSGADVTATGQAAEKIYRSQGPDTLVETRLDAGDGAWLEWLPQETILFNGARLRRRIELKLASGARVLAAETVVLGRTASGERFASGLLHDEWRVTVDGRLVWADIMHLADPMEAVLDVPAGLNGARALATIVYCANDAPARLDSMRAMLEEASGHEIRHGATIVGGLLLARLLSRDAQALRVAVARLVALLRAEAAGLPMRAPAMWRS